MPAASLTEQSLAPTVDSEGCVWVGMYNGWQALRYSPAGELIELPGARHELLFERPSVLARLWQALDARFVPRARLTP